MGSVDCLSRRSVGMPPRVSELDNNFVVSQSNSENTLLKPSATVSTGENKPNVQHKNGTRVKSSEMLRSEERTETRLVL